ncbi:MAG: gluconokinase [Luteolibacter sp.]
MSVTESTGAAGPFVVMGVSGCGKSTVAALLASGAGGVFLDADDFHPAENKAKMAASIPLTDEDRWPWLDALNVELRARSEGGQTVFLACSALREVYRSRLAAGLPGLRFIYLKGPKELIIGRLQGREGHFMPPALLASQFAILEEPADAIVVPIEMLLEEMVRVILAELSLPEEGSAGFGAAAVT